MRVKGAGGAGGGDAPGLKSHTNKQDSAGGSCQKHLARVSCEEGGNFKHGAATLGRVTAQNETALRFLPRRVTLRFRAGGKP